MNSILPKHKDLDRVGREAAIKIFMEDTRIKKESRTMSRSKRFKIFKRDNFTCNYCGSLKYHTNLHVDHIVPVCEGGGNNEDNLVTSCSSCNLKKSGMSLDSFKKLYIDTCKLEKIDDFFTCNKKGGRPSFKQLTDEVFKCRKVGVTERQLKALALIKLNGEIEGLDHLIYEALEEYIENNNIDMSLIKQNKGEV